MKMNKIKIGKISLIFLLSCLILLEAAVVYARSPVRAAILYNCTNRTVLYAQNETMEIPPASLTKVMSMFVALDEIRSKNISMNSLVQISARAAATGGSSMHLYHGEMVSLANLLLGMAVVSGNDASVAIAEAIGGSTSNFIDMMNKKARSLGMRDTYYRTVNGLPAPGQVTSARDLLILTVAYLRAHPDALNIHRTLFFQHRNFSSKNTNNLLSSFYGTDGLKTGWTIASGYNLIVTAKRGSTRLIAIVLGGRSSKVRDRAAYRLLETGFIAPDNANEVALLLGNELKPLPKKKNKNKVLAKNKMQSEKSQLTANKSAKNNKKELAKSNKNSSKDNAKANSGIKNNMSKKLALKNSGKNNKATNNKSVAKSVKPILKVATKAAEKNKPKPKIVVAKKTKANKSKSVAKVDTKTAPKKVAENSKTKSKATEAKSTKVTNNKSVAKATAPKPKDAPKAKDSKLASKTTKDNTKTVAKNAKNPVAKTEKPKADKAKEVAKKEAPKNIAKVVAKNAVSNGTKTRHDLKNVKPKHSAGKTETGRRL